MGTPWKNLSPKQRRIGLQRWHDRRDTARGGTPGTAGLAQREDNNPLYQPTVQLSGHALAAAARKLAGLEIAPQLQALDSQQHQVVQQGGRLSDRVSGYYDTLDARGQTSKASAQAISDRLNQMLQSIGGDSQKAIADQATAEQSRLQHDEESRGPGLDGGASAQLAGEAQALAGRAALTSQAYRTAGAEQGAGHEALVNAIVAAAQQRGGEVQGELAGREQSAINDISSKRTGVQSTRGGLETKHLTDLRQSAFENLVTQRGLKIKGTQLAQDAADSARNYAAAIARIGETQRHDQAGETVAQQNADTASQRATAYQQNADTAAQRLNQQDKPKDETEASHKLKRQLGNALSYYNKWLGQGRGIPKIESALSELGGTPDVVAAAGELAQFGYLTPATIKTLKRAGMTHIPSEWKRTGAQAVNGRT